MSQCSLDAAEILATENLPLGGALHPALLTPHFPARFQAVLWRNWGMISPERLARVLCTDEATVLAEAEILGLQVPPPMSSAWLHYGYITIIRCNWHLLPYEQLLQLLGWSQSHLLHVLHEEDFLLIKLGGAKPHCEPIKYSPLTEEQRKQTIALRQWLDESFPNRSDTIDEPAFGFMKSLETPVLPTRQAPLPKREEEVSITSDWKVLLPRNQKYAGEFAKHFTAAHAARWGEHILIGEGNASSTSPTIRLEIAPNSTLKPESHSIAISSSNILIKAVDETGLLRGLRWLERAMQKRKGPHLSTGCIERCTRYDLRLIHPYNALYGDTLVDPNSNPLPDGLLQQLSERGVNGVWLQGLLYSLFPWSYAPKLSDGYEARLEGLRRLCDKAGKYGIGLYLYLNEPRALPPLWFDEFPQLRELRGVHSDEHGTTGLCTSLPAVQEYLSEGMEWVCRHVPQLAGAFLITMSENLTNCWSWPQLVQQCPRCRERSQADVIAEVNSLLAEGARRADTGARIITWTWGWSNVHLGEAMPQWQRDCIAELPADVTVMATSEEGLPVKIGGVESHILDYSISQPGPSPNVCAQWRAAQAHGLRTVAKVQINNTWECSAVPYLPAPDLISQHLDALEEAGVSGLMLSWTLGGYPSPNLELAERHYWHTSSSRSTSATEDTLVSEADFEAERFGSAALQVRRAHAQFSQAFREFPFSIDGLYVAPQQFGPANPLYPEPTGLKGTPIGFPYDDLNTWRGTYTREVYENQWRKLSEGWREGWRELETAQADSKSARAALADLKSVARAAYLHFRSVYLQVAFVRCRDRITEKNIPPGELQNLQQRIEQIVSEEIALARDLYDVIGHDSRIGFEASNHYFYTRQGLLEKMLVCRFVQGRHDDQLRK